MDNNAEFNALIEEMGLTPGLVSTLTQTGRSTLHGYINNNAQAPAIAVSYMRLLRYLYENDRELFLNYLVLSEMENVKAGISDPRIALIYRDGKLRKPVREYIEKHKVSE